MSLADLLRFSGEPFREACARVDWAATPLGPESDWSPALAQAVSVCLSSRFPQLLSWGPDLVMVYNEAYVDLIGDKHPGALGRPTRDVFPELWPELEPLFAGVMAGGPAVFLEDHELHMLRSGFLEQTFFTFCYSPVLEADGRPGGVLDTVIETTRTVRSRRRLDVLRRLGEQLSPLRDERAVLDAALAVLRSQPEDLSQVDLVGSPLGAPVPDDRTLVVQVPVGDHPSGTGSGLELVVRVCDHLPVDDDVRDVLGVAARIVGGALAVSRALAQEAGRTQLQAEHTARLAALTVAMQNLSGASSEAAVLEVVARSSTQVLEADGTVVVLEGADGQLRSRFTAGFTTVTVQDLEVLPRDAPLPMADAAVHGRSWFFSDSVSGVAAFPDGAEAFARAEVEASASLPLRAGDRLLGALVMVWHHPRAFTAEEREVLEALASATAQALDRLAARDAEREAAARVGEIAEALQRSLLTQPPLVEGLGVATRYLPAGDHARVGGDWYDVFTGPDGVTRLVVGDVTGHDRDAAAAMGQLRNLLRGVSYCHPGTPSQVLADLEDAVIGLGVGTLATVLLAEVRWEPDGSALMTWANAGHPPPVVLRAGGGVDALADASPDLLLGLDVGWPRKDLTARLGGGDTLLLHTDGLVERRGEGLDVGQARLREALTAGRGQPLELWCDELLSRMGTNGEDDVVVLAVRVLPPAGDGALVVPRHPASVAEVRRYTRTSCAGLPEGAVDVATLLVSELTTNAVVHGDGRITVRVVPLGNGVRVEVSDEAEAMPVERHADLDAEGGRGIELVARLAREWGLRREGTGKTVWFEIS